MDYIQCIYCMVIKIMHGVNDYYNWESKYESIYVQQFETCLHMLLHSEFEMF